MKRFNSCGFTHLAAVPVAAVPVAAAVTLLLACFAASGCQTQTGSTRAGEREESSGGPPNIVLIVADDLGYGDLSCYGCKDIHTPYLDRLAREGVRFTAFYANGPECSPTRTALLTGRYQQRVPGLECAIGTGNAGRYDDAIRLAKENRLGLPPGLNVLPSQLKAAGYRTAIVGKWHLGYEPQFRPGAHGFDYSFGPLGGGVDYFHHTEPKGEFLGADLPGEPMLYLNGEPHTRKGYLTHLLTEAAVNWIGEQSADTPFFLYVPYTAPHAPYQGPGDFRPEKLTGPEWGKGNRKVYGEMVREMDRGVRDIVAALQEKSQLGNTVVIFFSDNGPARYGDTGGLHGRKGRLFEGGIRVPCIVRYPRQIRPGSVSSQPCISMDLTASIVRLAGARAPADRPLDGMDILAHVAKRQPDVSRTLYWRARRGKATRRAVRSGDLKYIRESIGGGRVMELLFNLREDPEERENLLAKRLAEASRLKEMLAEWEKEVEPGEG